MTKPPVALVFEITDPDEADAFAAHMKSLGAEPRPDLPDYLQDSASSTDETAMGSSH